MRTARPAWAAWLREQGVVAIEDVDTRALVRRIRADGVLRCAVGEAPVEELHARALAQPPIDGRPLDRHASAPTSRTSSAPARALALARPRLQALDPAPARGDRRRGRGRPGRLGRRRDPRARAARGADRQRPGRSGGARRADRDRARAARPRAALRHLPRPPAARPRARLPDVQAAVRPPRREPSRARCAHRPRARDRAEPRLRRRGGRVREPRLAERRHRRGARGRGLRDACSSIPRRRPGPLDGLPFFDQVAEACRAARIFAPS